MANVIEILPSWSQGPINAVHSTSWLLMWSLVEEPGPK